MQTYEGTITEGLVYTRSRWPTELVAKYMRAVLLPLTGDPVIATFWWKFFSTVWQDEVDKLYVQIDVITPVYIVEYIHQLYDHPKVVWVLGRERGHGEALKALVNYAQEPYLMLIEEDAYIFREGAVSEQFKRVESGQFDFIGSPRESCSLEIAEAAYKKFNVDKNVQLFDVGPNFWPNFVFVKRELLLKTDMNFDSKSWKAGETIKELDLTLKEHADMDTFGWMSIQVRILTDKIGIIPQFKAYPIDPYLARNKEWTFAGIAKWIHAGSLSSGVTRYLKDEGNHPLFAPSDVFEIEQYDHEDFVMRCAWWHLALTKTGNILSQLGLQDFVEKYAFAIHKLMEDTGVSERELHERMDLYERLLNN